MKSKLFKLSWIFAIFLVAGCEVDSGDDADGGTDAGGTGTDTGGTGTDTAGPTLADYKFILIEDLSATAGEDPGADIDAVVLIKDGVSSYAEAPEEYSLADDSVPLRRNEFDAIGAPDAYTDYPAATGACQVDGNFVSLGGTGGYLILEMEEAIETGDTLQVVEIGSCTFDGGTARAEEIRVSVSTSSDYTGNWVVVGSGESDPSPIITFTVPTLPDVEM